MSEDRFTTIQAIARRWRTSAAHVRNLIARGHLRAIRIGGKLRVSESALADFERANTVRPAHLDYLESAA